MLPLEFGVNFPLPSLRARAKQSRLLKGSSSGLLHRYAPRNDGKDGENLRKIKQGSLAQSGFIALAGAAEVAAVHQFFQHS